MITKEERDAISRFDSCDFNNCSVDLKAWAFSCLSYRERDVSELIRIIFNRCVTRFWSTRLGSHFHGVVIDKDSEAVFQVNRGTDGYNALGKLASWMYDLRIFKNREGVHSGFAALGSEAFAVAYDYLREFPMIIHTGHSQGAGVALYNAGLSCKYINNNSWVRFITFAAPPTGDHRFAGKMRKYMKQGRLSGKIHINPQDPIASKKLRDSSKIFLNGEDVGRIVILPDINNYDRGLGSLFNHSCEQYNAALSLWLNEPVDRGFEDDRLQRGPAFSPKEEDRNLLTLLSTLIEN